MSPWVDAQPSATYAYWVRFRCSDNADPAQIVGRVTLHSDFQFAPAAFARVLAGENNYGLTITPLDGRSLKDAKGLAVKLQWEEAVK